MFIKGNHIYIRALEPSDLDFLYALENDTANWQVSNTIAPFSKALLTHYLESVQDIYTTKQLRLIICNTNTNTAIGTIDLFDFEPLHSRVGLGILILEDYRKQGYAIEALELIITYTKNTLLLNQLYCNIGNSNTQSKALF
jgi:diamine N-acetyltransferase